MPLVFSTRACRAPRPRMVEALTMAVAFSSGAPDGRGTSVPGRCPWSSAREHAAHRGREWSRHLPWRLPSHLVRLTVEERLCRVDALGLQHASMPRTAAENGRGTYHGGCLLIWCA